MTDKRRKELKRVRQFIRRAEKRGYKFSSEFKESISNKTTRALRFLTPRKLYEQAVFSVGKKEVSGLAGRRIERERSARKAQITRKYGKERDRIENELLRRALEETENEIYPLPDISHFYEGEIVYNNLIDLVEDYPSSKGAEYLSNLLRSEIATYGRDNVIAGIANAPEDLITIAQEIIFYEANSSRMHSALRAFSDAIRGGIILSKEESKDFNNVIEGAFGYADEEIH